MIQRAFKVLLVSAGTVFLSQPALAQADYPNRPIKWIVPWAPGAPGDIAGRAVAERMAQSMKQPVVIENRPGAGGTLGYQEAIRHPADGYTLFMLSSATLVAPLLFPTQKFEFTTALQPIGNTHWNYNALVVQPDSPFKNPQDITAKSRAEPNSLSYASGGNGTPAHLIGATFMREAGTVAQHVPYNQFGMAVTDVLAGRVHFMFLTTAGAMPHLQAGKMKALAVTSARRLPALPDTPTMVELGYPQFIFRSFEGMTVRAGTPRLIVERLNAELLKALADASLRDRFSALGWEVEPMSPEQFGKVIESEGQAWLKAGRAAGIQVN